MDKNMHEIPVTLTIRVLTDDESPLSLKAAQQAAGEMVNNAINHSIDVGTEHSLNDTCSIAYGGDASGTVAEKPTLDDLLDLWTVMEPGNWENEDGPEGWYAVTNDEGIVAYFGNESDAFRFRLSEINRIMNP
jgi:hypothetical protein